MDRYCNQVGVFQLFLVAFWLIVLMESQVYCHNEESSLVNVTFIENAVEKGAVCLDGSPGAYYFASGLGDGSTNWLLFLKGGAWCSSEYSCLERSRSALGSNKNASALDFKTILSPNQDTNPDFYNWNRVFVLYCDGASFMADVEDVNPETKVYRRGRRIFGAILDELIATKGMNNATNALLLGESAGGLATILNCARFHSYVPNACRVKCFSDSGFFIQAPNLPGAISRENYYSNVTAYHEIARFLPESCTSRMEAPSLCLFAENVVGDVKTPLFLLNSDFDQYQISTNVKPNPPDDQGWKACTDKFKTLHKCTATQLQIIKDFQIAFLEALNGLNDNPSRGLFINSCFIHAFLVRDYWQETPTLANKTIRQAFGDWYFDRGNVQLMDNQHPNPINCNATELYY